eukprot:jgi/Astpho2/4400/e_gw1.00067.138.1_t
MPLAGSSSTQPRQQSEGAVDAAVEPAGQLAAFLLLISPFFFWGTSMVAMKELAPHTSPLFVSAVRLLPAGGALIAWAAAQGRRQPEGLQAWGAIALFGLVDGTAFQGCLAEGLQRTSAGLGSVIIDSQPLTVTLLAALLFGERIRPAGALGLLAGVAGLCLLELPPEALQGLVQQSTTGGLGSWLPKGSSLWDSGAWWMLLSAQSMAVGTIMVRWVCRYVDPVMATGWHMVLGSMPLLALSAAQEADELMPRLAQITGYDLALLVYISMLGSAASYGVFFYNASRGNLTALSSLTFLTPMFAAGCGYLTIGETLTPLQLVGASITLGGVALINAKPADKECSS